LIIHVFVRPVVIFHKTRVSAYCNYV
jgi:hypothetical protein